MQDLILRPAFVKLIFSVASEITQTLLQSLTGTRNMGVCIFCNIFHFVCMYLFVDPKGQVKLITLHSFNSVYRFCHTCILIMTVSQLWAAEWLSLGMSWPVPWFSHLLGVSLCAGHCSVYGISCCSSSLAGTRLYSHTHGQLTSCLVLSFVVLTLQSSVLSASVQATWGSVDL